MPVHRIQFTRLLSSTLLLLAANLAVGQTLQGDLSPYNHPAYAGIASHFLLENATLDGAYPSSTAPH